MGLFKDKHVHKWTYMFSNGDNSVQWYTCECLAQCCTELDPTTSKIKAPTVFEVTIPLVMQKKKSRW
jgi:hypothetical protein